tara:strand:- start:328 stop:468 length:141 start_codon:yes stop_codon:yes gene_type:complete
MKKKEIISRKKHHKKLLKVNRLKKLADQLKSNIVKRKKSKNLVENG